jgi:hypothetical protein
VCVSCALYCSLSTDCTYPCFRCDSRFDAADKGQDFDKAIKDVKKEKSD